VPAARTFEEEIWKAVDRRILAPSRLAASAAALRVGVYEPSALQSALAEHGKALNKVLERLISQLPAAKEGARGLNVPNLLMHIRRQLTLAAPTRPDGTLQEGAARSCEALMTLPGFSERAVEAYTECFTSGWLPPALFAQLLTHHLHESVPALLRQPSHWLEWCLLGVQQVARALQGAAASQRNARHDSGGRSGMPPPLVQTPSQPLMPLPPQLPPPPQLPSPQLSLPSPQQLQHQHQAWARQVQQLRQQQRQQGGTSSSGGVVQQQQQARQQQRQLHWQQAHEAQQLLAQQKRERSQMAQRHQLQQVSEQRPSQAAAAAAPGHCAGCRRHGARGVAVAERAHRAQVRAGWRAFAPRLGGAPVRTLSHGHEPLAAEVPGGCHQDPGMGGAGAAEEGGGGGAEAPGRRRGGAPAVSAAAPALPLGKVHGVRACGVGETARSCEPHQRRRALCHAVEAAKAQGAVAAAAAAAAIARQHRCFT